MPSWRDALAEPGSRGQRIRQAVEGIQRPDAAGRGDRELRERPAPSSPISSRCSPAKARARCARLPRRNCPRSTTPHPRARAADQADAAAQGRGRRAQRHPRSARRHRRRRGGAVRRRAVPHVSALRRRSRLALRGAGHLRDRARRLQGGDRRDHRPRRVRPAQVRIRRAPRAARARDRGARAASIPRRRPSPCCPRPRRSTSRSTTRICASTCSARAAPAASRSTPPTAPCASPICRPGSSCSQQDEKSQHKNKAKALKVLRARLYERERQAREAARAADRKSQVGSGDRSERIRTYNFPQGRVTDHRINLTLYKIDKVMNGEALDEIIDALLAEDQAARLAEVRMSASRRIRDRRGRRSPIAAARLGRRRHRRAAPRGAPALAAGARLEPARGARLSGATMAPARAASGSRRWSARRRAREPVSRILGKREFWSLDFALSPDTLDPRPDSETLIEAALGALCRSRPRRIASSISAPAAAACCWRCCRSCRSGRASGIDIVPRARSRRRGGMPRRSGLADRARFLRRRLGDAACRRGADVILANPPYIATGDIDGLAPEVARFEPRAGARWRRRRARRLSRAWRRRSPGCCAPAGIAVSRSAPARRASRGGYWPRQGLTIAAVRHDLSWYGALPRCCAAKVKRR